MALTESNMLDLGIAAPDFNLPDTRSGKSIQYQDIAGENGTLVMFICNHCPYVIHVLPELARLTTEYQAKGIGMVAISSNDVENYPADSPDKMKVFAAEEGFTYPYLYDESQDVAKAYDAACTPDFYLFDQNQKLAYRGRLDQSRPNNNYSLDGADLRTALDQLIAGETIPSQQYPSAGCNIKWKK